MKSKVEATRNENDRLAVTARTESGMMYDSDEMDVPRSRRSLVLDRILWHHDGVQKFILKVLAVLGGGVQELRETR